MSHPTREQIADLIDGRLTDAARRRVEAHLEACGRCADLRRALASLIATMTVADSTPEPPAHLVAAVIERFGARGARTLAGAASTAGASSGAAGALAGWLAGVVTETARLVFDSLAAPSTAFAGARGGEQTRRLRFEGGGIELDLQIEEIGEAARLVGQVITADPEPRPAAGIRFRVTSDDRVLVEGASDQLGEFLVELAAGATELPGSDPHQPAALAIHLHTGSRAVRCSIPSGR
ncbi:MAG: zf-HC2 domain-containing protein [Candidatus Eiseniibacteriota bacterium]